MTDLKPPKVFISYAWEDDTKTWVLNFAKSLRLAGIDAILDQWATAPGDQLTQFMDESVRESDFVVFICTPSYKRKSDGGKGGVGYEGHIITGEVFAKNNHRKFIPVLRKGNWKSASPSWATSKLFIDLRGNSYDNENYQNLLDTLHHKLPDIPPLGRYVFLESEKKVSDKKKIKSEFEHTKVSDGKGMHRSNWNIQIIVAIIGALAIILGATIPYLFSNVRSVFAASTPTPIPPEIKDIKEVSMRLIPASEVLFMMGSDNGNNGEKPAHEVYLHTFFIDTYEVTNSLYRECVEDEACEPPKESSSELHIDYYENLQYAEYPVVWVDWEMANRFCQWRGARLPTEAEWEKAARGFDSRSYPWGEELTCAKANYSGCFGDTNPVGLFEGGKSIYGLYDLIGNVSEWVADWYSESYYVESYPKGGIDPSGPSDGVARVVRGGSWYTSISGLKVFNRTANSPLFSNSDLGFRCAKSVTQ